jgi:hypothetical protein
MVNLFLKKIVEYLIGKDVFGKIQDLVGTLMLNTELTGDQKRELALSEAKTFGGEFATYLLNLSIEVAVTLLKK